LADNIRAQREQQFEEARLHWFSDPADIDNIIWAGRRAAYLGRYQEAILILGLGIKQYPDEPRLYRHRGHRYITTRQLDSAVVDLERAAALIEGQMDQVEPDGLPNRQNIPTSTLHSNIWYHLGLARYLQGDYQRALEAYQLGVAGSTNKDMEVAARYWLYLTLVRLDRTDDATAVAIVVEPDWPVLENTTYLQLLLLYGGSIPVGSLLPATTTGTVGSVTAGYGVAQWYHINGQQEDAQRLLDSVLASGQWPAFGYIAAEADVARVER
jgi:tetratricopeptide (TPR) repeat protein